MGSEEFQIRSVYLTRFSKLSNNDYMKGKLFINVFIFLFLVSYSSPLVRAHEYKKAVLGDSVEASDIAVPPITAGPGIILPDSPFYGLDKLIQNLKLFLAFQPERKAEMHDLIAQERLSELRIMMAKNHKSGVTTALSELAKENLSSAVELRLAASEGKDVKKLALRLNDSMKLQRTFLDTISDQSTGSLKLQLKAAKEDLKVAKVEVEDELPEDELLKEVEETLAMDLVDDIEQASESAGGLSHSIDVLTKLASEAAEKELTNREETLRKVIASKSNSLKSKEEQKLAIERKKQEKVYQLNKEVVEQARETVEAAQATAEKYENAKKAEQELKQPSENNPS